MNLDSMPMLSVESRVSVKRSANPKAIIRRVLTTCADCDTCRFLMNEDCLFFPSLYRIVDQEAESGQPSSRHDLRRLADLCTLCGMCPCPDIRTDIIRAKSAFLREAGIPINNRLLADVQQFGRICGKVAGVAGVALSIGPVSRIVKRLTGIHPDRRLPLPPRENFFDWAKNNGLRSIPEKGRGVAYFAGCSAGYFFPEVARAAVTVVKSSGIEVVVPPQQCCGMPTLVEGHAGKTHERMHFNINTLLALRRRGYEPVSSCPTCSFLMKVLLKEGAYYSRPYQQSVGAAENEIKIPDSAGRGNFVCLRKSMYGKLLHDDGFFNALDPLDRIALSDSFSDIGEYLVKRLDSGRLTIRFNKLFRRLVYFVSCHQREQNIGSPYERLLSLVPGLSVKRVGGPMDCCGMGGSLGFKKGFHKASVSLGTPLTEKIRAAAPELVVTDCLSCRLQFQHLMPYPVLHPLEVLAMAAGS